MVTHNVEVASAGDRIVHMRDGRVETDGRDRSGDTAAAKV
jgi:ABC-type lipoprotein export system ATPase subunit